MFRYPVELTPDDNGTVMLAFVDIPGATFGDDQADAIARGRDALETVLQTFIDDRGDIPEPSPLEGRPFVSPSLLAQLKVTLYRAMRRRGWRKADLARALAANPRQIDRLFDLHHSSTIGQIGQALAACGQAAEVSAVELDRAA